MREEKIINMVIDLLKLFNDGKINAKTMINKYDKIIRKYYIWDTKNKKLKMIEQFQDVLALFVENPDWRKEDSSYYGYEELREKVKRILSLLSSSAK